MKITSKQDEKSSENQKESEETTQPSKSRRALIATGVVLALSLVVGAAVGLLIQRPKRIEEPKTTEAPPAETKVDPRANIVLADAALASGEVGKAIALYNQSKPTVAAQPRLLVPLLYKLASAQEAAGNYELALKHYRNINQQDLSPISIAAKLGEARVLFQLGQPKIATNELAPLAMVSAAPELELTEAGMLLRYTSALIHSAQAQADLPKNPVHHEHLFREKMPTFVASAIRLLEASTEQLGAASLKRLDLGLQVLGKSGDPETTLVSCQFPTQPAALLVEMLGQQTGWDIAPSRQAIEMLSAKRVEVQLRDKTAGEMLSLLLEPLDLYWSFRDRTLTIDRAENFPTIYRKYQLRRRTLFALQDALALAPNHEMAPQAYLALGNLAVMGDQFDRAATHYRDLEQRFPKSEMAPLSKFNLAKTLLMQSKTDEANDVFYSVMDETGETPARPLAYYFVGSSFLERENFRAAKRELSRCASLAVRDEVRAPAAMTLATTYLLADEGGGYATANAVLMDYQDSLRKDAWQNEAVFLTALIQYRAATRSADIRRRGHELMTAAIKVDPNAYFGNFGHLMVGNALSDLALSSLAVKVFRDGIQKYTLRDNAGPIEISPC